MKILHGLLVCALLLGLAACGVSRAPLPPSLHLPQPAQDLKASRKADHVTLTWTLPRQSTDLEPLNDHLGVTRICRSVGTRSASCQPVAELPRRQLPVAPVQPSEGGQQLPVQATFADVLPKDLQQQNATGMAVYAVEMLNQEGRSAGLSNLVEVPLAPVPEPPRDISAQVTPQGVMLSFSPTFESDAGHTLGQGAAGGEASVSNYRIYRTMTVSNASAGKEGNASTALGFPQASDHKLVFQDNGVEWESAYTYRVTPVTWSASGAEVEGEDSQPIQVFTHDTFAPAAPSGLQAVSSGTSREKFIDLTWAPNTESDLAGYNLYRREDGSARVRINSETITTPAYRDTNVEAGKTYSYTVSAIDIRRNESAQSAEANETVP